MTLLSDEARRQWNDLAAKTLPLLAKLEVAYPHHGDTLRLYRAGLQGDEVRFGLFGRDLLFTARLLGDPEFTKDVLRFIGDTLGRRVDSVTGEEPGRGIHEFDRVEMRGYLTRYNAADVTPLFLVTAHDYLRETSDEAPLSELADEIRLALKYLMTHLSDGLYVEDPAYAGADGYALRATYWKDSRLPARTDPAYPVTYTLVQAVAIAALRSAGELVRAGLNLDVKAGELTACEGQALDALRTRLWNPEADVPLIALDSEGPIGGVSSDMLHMLAYLEPGDLGAEKLRAILEASSQLATPYGYRTYAPGQVDYDPHSYHLGAIWPFEQAFILEGAARHGLTHVADAACRVADVLEIEGFPELVYWEDGGPLEGARSVEGQGCDLQLWTLAVPHAALREDNVGSSRMESQPSGSA